MLVKPNELFAIKSFSDNFLISKPLVWSVK